MYKVMIVDDEMFVRKGLMNLIDWASLGYEICAEAENGQEALELMALYEPDVVITDIRMPVLDGLNLIRTVTSERGKQPLFMIISGYHDFAYAQQALRYGVQDYVLKPIDEEELAGALRKMESSLSMNQLSRITGAKQLTGPILETLIKGELSDSDAQRLAAAIRAESNSRFVYIAAELHPADPEAHPPVWTAQQMADVLSNSAALGAAGYPIPVHEQAPGLFGILLDMRYADRSADAFLQALHMELELGLKTPVTLYAGTVVSDIGQVKSSYQAANEALAYKYAEDGTKVIFIEKVRGTPLYYFDLDAELYTMLLERLEEGDEEQYLKALNLIFLEFRTKRFSPNAVSGSILRAVIGVINIIREMEGSEKELAHVASLMDWQSRHVRLQSLKQLLAAFLKEADRYIAILRRDRCNGGIDKIKKYIEAHYMENINLKSIAASFYMNPVYLGQLFRKTYGVYFNEFLLGLRIGEAKKLLRQTDLRMYEVAEKVGFQNADYFVTQFEKLEHMTPTDYRNKLRGKL
ncbi:response regulator [Paenibacillus chartarius]|uniref:Response regulator n=1 Tax=Paenibacillus chartarius TaxID=747481 RepID=A0ABV6DP95_9BACL